MIQYSFYSPVCILENASYRLVCNMVNLWNNGLNFVGTIFDVNVYNSAKFGQLTMSKNYIPRNELFERFWTLLNQNLQTRWITSTTFVPPHKALHLLYIYKLHHHTTSSLEVPYLFVSLKHLPVKHCTLIYHCNKKHELSKCESVYMRCEKLFNK